MKKSLVLWVSVLSLSLLSACGGGSSGSAGPSVNPATHFTVSAPAAATAGTAVQAMVTSLDASNNVVASYSGTVHFSSTDGQAVLPANSMLVNGTGSFPVTLGTAAGQTITATDSVNASITGTSSSITVSAGAASHFSITAPAIAMAGTAFNITVTALDAFSNTATSYSGTVHFTSTDAQAVLPANSTLTNGAGTFSPTLKTSGSETISATDSVTASITGTSNSVAVSGPATHFSVTVPASTNIGQAFNFTVTALDASNNVATSYSGTAHFTSSDAQATLPVNSTLTNGIAGFSATLNTLGSETISATDIVTASITGTSSSIQVTTSRFKSAGSMAGPRAGHTATLLGNGKVLIAGGVDGQGFLATAELFDPAGTSFASTGSLTTPRFSHTATLLGNGKVLIAGGGNGASSLATAELFDPSKGSFTLTSSMTTARQDYTATLLGNGKVLIAGGFDGTEDVATAELFDPSNGSFTLTGSMAAPREAHTATLLGSGKVLIAGGSGNLSPLATAELFDPSNGHFTATGSMTTAREAHSATLLGDGKVLIAGGVGTGDLKSSELYDPSAGSFASTGSLLAVQRFHTATLLNDGTVLIAGGDFLIFGPLRGCQPQPVSSTSAELYNPASGTFAFTSNMAASRSLHTATMLPGGEVLVTGGVQWTSRLLPDGCFQSTSMDIASAELFQ